MTLKEFSKKYDIPYSVVYEASWKVPTEPTLRRDREFPERPLFNEVRKLLIKRVERHMEIASRQKKILDRMRGVHP